ncbi:amidohydrolase family protein [Ningiella sp. W23]|uniref:amidohydrolase family protein n=1 Tax=Ningiella sp. W23 TaxID=3023715 RepID=UPI0037569E7E
MIRYIFPISSAVVLISLVLLIFVLPTDTQSTDEALLNTNNTSNSFVLKNVKVFQDVGFQQLQDLRVNDGFIVEIGHNLSVDEQEHIIDGNARYVLPGLIDAHTHSYGSALSDALRFGVTTQLDMFTDETMMFDVIDNRNMISKTDKTDLYSSGMMATVEGGHGTQYGIAIDTIDSLDDIPSWISARKSKGADYIKIVYMPYQNSLPSLDKTTATALIEEAQRQDMLALAHISSQAAAKDMIEAGINGLVHIFADSLAEKELVIKAKQNKVFIIPTLAVIASVSGHNSFANVEHSSELNSLLSPMQKQSLLGDFGFSSNAFSLELAKQNVAKFHAGGVKIVAGSDAPNPGTAFGISLHHEMQLLSESGLSNAEVLQAATRVPASLFSIADKGRIASGMRADLVLLNQNPNENIKHSNDIYQIYKNGFEVRRSIDAEQTSGKRLSNGILGDFDSDDTPFSIYDPTVEDFIWSHSDDRIANGQSKASIEVVYDDQQQSHVLKVSANVNAGFAFPWAGAAIGDFIPPIVGLDISSYSALAFKVKGSEGQYRVMAFSATQAGVPPTVNFTVSEQWESVEISLSDFGGLDISSFSGFAIVAGPQANDHTFYIDSVQVK